MIKMKITQKIFNILPLLILCAGSFWHLSNICGLYFSYPTNIVIDTDFNTDEKAVPAITFCANIWNITRNRKTDEIFKDIDLNKVIVDVHTSEYFSAKDEDLKEYSLEQISEFLSLRYYCFTINIWLKGVIVSLSKSLRIKLNTINANASWWMFIHDTFDRPSSYDWNTIDLEQKKEYWVTFKLKSFQLLRGPYPTNCINYLQETNFKTQKDCIRLCKRQLMERECGYLSHEVDVLKGEPSVRFANTVDDEKCGKNIDIKTICRRMCPNVDCIKYFYQPKMISSSENEHGEKYIDLRLSVPSEPFTSYIHRPQIQTIEFLCYIASILSLWFGFSFLSLCLWLRILFFKIKEFVLFKYNYQNNVHANYKKVSHRRKRIGPVHSVPVEPIISYF